MSLLSDPATLAKFQALQRNLAAAGLYTGPIDDDWGPGTDEAIAQLFKKAKIAIPKPVVTPIPAAILNFERLDPDYRWLARVGTLPRMIQEALALYGTVELAGTKNSPTIMGWANETNLKNVYTADATPWCGLFMAVVALRAGKTPPTGPLWALNWSKFGREVGQPMLGDVLTFTRNGGGHVALYVGEDKTTYHVLGGNQSDAVGFARIEKKRLNSTRRPVYNSQPASVKPYLLSMNGKISTNEA